MGWLSVPFRSLYPVRSQIALIRISGSGELLVLATGTTEIFEFFLRGLSDLCGEEAFHSLLEPIPISESGLATAGLEYY